MKKREHKKKKKKTWLKVTSIIVGLLILAGGVTAYSVWNTIANTAENIHKPIERETDKREEAITLEKQDPFSVLLLGVDERENDRGRSDTMIAITVNPQTNSVKMLSIPRDTRTEIIGRDKEDKINHAYAYGGPKMSMDTVENLLNIPIDYYVKVNMEGFSDLVDAVGGIKVNNTFAFSYEGFDFPLGQIELSGNEALSYTRMRYEDPNGDFGRQQRQRQVIEGIVREGMSVNSIKNYQKIFDALGKNIETNMTLAEIMSIQENYRDALNSIEQLTVESNGTMINDIYYGIIDEEEISRVQKELQEHLKVS
ncbi:LytR family transcriptional regulator [Bacillus sp. AGMB 02131]|uniref:Polyisoprenyl-teichoic acid--peptidoglycan teichoic acid transferase TagU n=1 Tax=Peribacillus faecalis TaxID=2772559 RepID=A0A927HDZ7_9BACI|nr:LytR family transcriptional regulator [Peribacillus faecalis]MBD3109988.1 LytR family transcriptional regulator [Peribacillus faecalis]